MYQIFLLNVSELSDITIDNPQSLTNTNDSNILQFPEHNITQNPITIEIKMTLLIIRTKTTLLL